MATRRHHGVAVALLGLIAPVLLSACAGLQTADGFNTSLHEEPPFIDGRPTPNARPAHLGIVFQEGPHGGLFGPDAARGSAVRELLDSLNAHLGSMGRSRALASWSADAGRGPDVRFGCELDAGEVECLEEVYRAGHPRYMHLGARRPSREWVAALGPALDRVDADVALVLTLEVSSYWPEQLDWKGRKGVRLGVGRVQQLPWLTSLDQPVEVIQLTGSLVDRDGRLLAIGAEGLLARPTSIVPAGFGFRALIRDEDVALLLRAAGGAGATERAWAVALENLVEGLLGG